MPGRFTNNFLTTSGTPFPTFALGYDSAAALTGVRCALSLGAHDDLFRAANAVGVGLRGGVLGAQMAARAQEATGGQGGRGPFVNAIGGAGGGAGMKGGDGGGTFPGSGGLAGTADLPNGRIGDDGVDGGGGGGGGYSNRDGSSALIITVPTAGGRGGAGGGGGSGGSGGGGAGGDGLVSTAASVTVNATVTGGDGGGGVPRVSGPGGGGSGGGGGAGLMLDSQDTTINAAVTGGNGGFGLSFGSGGGGGAGIVLQQGGELNVDGTVVSGGLGGRGVGGAGVKANAVVAVTVTGFGTIRGGNANDIGVDATGSGGAGLDAASGGTIVNAGTIAGGNGGGHAVIGGTGGIGGTGSGGAKGGDPNAAGFQGVGGAGIIGAGLSITNSGTIEGGTGGVFGQASAIVFTGGDNFLANSGTISGGIAVRGGSFAPALASSAVGTKLDIGNAPLIFSTDTSYNIRVSADVSDSVTTSRTATLTGAKVKAVFAPGAYYTRQYTILTADDGLGGTTFAGLTNIGLPANITSSLSYDSNNVFLDLFLNYVAPGGLNANQQGVATTLTNFFNNTGSIPRTFAALDPRGLTQASGEVGTSAALAAFDAQSQFLNVLTDPFTGGQDNGQGAAESSPALGYAAACKSQPNDACASLVTKAPPMQTFEQRWRVFGAAYGGTAQIGGNAALGSHDATSQVSGVMGGAAYALSPATRVGFAFGGGGTSFGLSDGLGSGRSDMFQAGVFARHGFAQGGYLSGALAYGWHDVSTDRVTSTGERLRGDYKADVLSGRIEAGWRFATQFAGVRPYAAAQAISYRMPNYLEQGNGGPNSFALDYAGRTVTATRSELGMRFDRAVRVDDALVTWRGRAAWAHNFDTGNGAAATFLSLPGAGFVVNGAAVAPNAALVSAGAEVAWRNGFALAATFEGEFSNNVQSYAGKGSIRYRW